MPGLPLIFRLILVASFALLHAMPVVTESATEIIVGGTCSLADAIGAANNDAPAGGCPAGRGGDLILLEADITLAAELPAITTNISIHGNGHTISGAEKFRIFQVAEAGELEIRQLAMIKGFADGGGAILNRGTVEIEYSSLLKNHSTSFGGAVDNAGALRVVSSILRGNSAKMGGESEGGAVYNSGKFSIYMGTVTENEASEGAAFSNSGDMEITKTTLTGNKAYMGGAIYNKGWASIEQSVITNNEGNMSGGIESHGPTSRLTIANSTLSGNHGGQFGGAISAFGAVFLTHVTIVDNVAGKGGGIFRSEDIGGLVNLRNSIIAGNHGGDCTIGLDENISNLIGDGSCDPAISGEPKLQLVTGANTYYLPRDDSPALNAGDPDFCAAEDQIGTKRPPDDKCDIGAIESTTASASAQSAAQPRKTSTAKNCSLADQIIAANTDQPYGACPAGNGADVIVMKYGDDIDEKLPPITSDITIEGGGRRIYARGMHQFFEVLGGSLEINNLHLVGGYSPWTGGAINVLKGTLVLRNSTIRDSSAIYGGAIFSDGGDITIIDSRFINNSAIGLGGWDAGLGGAIFSSGVLSISNSVFSANSATDGGALLNRGPKAKLSVIKSRFESNSATKMGGAINNYYGELQIDGSVFVGNFVGGHYYHPGHGGAIANRHVMILTNSTITDNVASRGSGIWLSYGAATIQHVTIARNRGGDGAIHSEFSAVRLRNSFIADNHDKDCLVLAQDTFEENVGNFIGDGSCNPAISGNPLIDTYNAALTFIPLPDGSPALDAGDPAYCLPFDQLGTPRPVGGRCDIGALESTSASPPPPTPAPTRCTLADQIIAANTDAPSGLCPAGNGADIISLDSDISLSAKLPAVKSEITIEGNGHTIEGDGKHRIFEVKGGELTLNSLRMTGGKAREDGGAIWIDRDSVVNINSSQISGNAAQRNGGAIWINFDSQLNISDSAFSGNTAKRDGGAIYSNGAWLSNVEWTPRGVSIISGTRTVFSTMNIVNTVFSDNHAGSDGGAISNDHGRQVISGSAFSANYAGGAGGAIDNNRGELTISGSHFNSNVANYWGGAISSRGHFEIWETVFTRNTAGSRGGAIRVIRSEPSTLADSVFTHNSAGESGGAIESHMAELHIAKTKFYDNRANNRVWDIHVDRLFDLDEETIKSGQVTFHIDTKVDPG